jgi:photosystem II stability/assembly factor-like uncharacterized protein
MNKGFVRIVGFSFLFCLVVLAAPPRAMAAGTWEKLGYFPGANVGRVRGMDFNTVLVAGNYTPSGSMPGGRIYRSVNGGKNFESIKLDLCMSVADLEVARDGQNGWAIGIGIDAKSYRTSDGGKTWTPFDFKMRQTKKAVAFSDSLYGWAVGQQGIVEHTTDGGTTWVLQVAAAPGQDLVSVDFVDRLSGWAAGGTGIIRHTADGGKTWSAQSSGVTADLTGIAFTDALRGVAVGKVGTVLATTDGGANWVKRTVPRETGYRQPFGDDLRDLAWADAATVFAVGTRGTLIRSSDRGATWTDESDSGVTANFNGIGAAGGTRAWMTAEGGYLYRFTYTPPPTKWIKRPSASTAALYAVDFVDTSYGWAVGSGGTILKTVDGGASWTQVGKSVPGLSEKLLSGVDFVDRKTGWVVGNKYPASSPLAETGIYRTDDGGITWSKQIHPNDGTFVFRVRMRNKDEGWILGEQWRVDQVASPPARPYSSILRTTDGGATWVGHRDAPPDLVRDVSFPDASTGYAVGYRGSNFKTSDGGTNWTPMPGLTGIARVMGVVFTSPTSGIAAGDQLADVDGKSPGLVSRTTDGGTTWLLTPIPTTAQLRCASAYKNSIWVVGENGTIIRSSDGGLSWGAQTSGTTQGLWSVQVVNNDFVVAVGGGGTIVLPRSPVP